MYFRTAPAMDSPTDKFPPADAPSPPLEFALDDTLPEADVASLVAFAAPPAPPLLPLIRGKLLPAPAPPVAEAETVTLPLPELPVAKTVADPPEPPLPPRSPL